MEESKRLPWSPFIDSLVVPGDIVLDLSEIPDQTVELGFGLSRLDPLERRHTIQATIAGKLRLSEPNKYWIESSVRRYNIPSVEDKVLGTVVDTSADNFLVDINGTSLAFLPVLAFEGGIRSNIPSFKTGTVVYARVVKLNGIMNPELSCMDACGKASGFGELKGGYVFDTSTGMSRMLSSPKCPLLETLGEKLAFEIVAGLNGRVWVNAPSRDNIIVVTELILRLESLDDDREQRAVVEDLLERLSMASQQVASNGQDH